MSTSEGESPVSRWIQSPQSAVPYVTKNGLKGRDPETGLEFNSIDTLTSRQQKEVPNHRKVFINKDSSGAIVYTLVYFFGIVTKASHGRAMSQKRVIVVSQKALYVLYINTGISRCIPLTDIEQIITSPDRWMGVNISGSHDVAFKVETAKEMKQLIIVLQCMCQHVSGRPLHIQKVNGNQTTVKSKMALQKQQNWSAKTAEVIPLNGVTKQQLDAAFRSVGCDAQAQPSTPIASVQQQQPSSAFAEVLPVPDDSERRLLLKRLSQLVQESEQLSDISSENDDLLRVLQEKASGIIKNRSQLCNILGIEVPSDSDSTSIMKLQLGCKTRDKLSQIANIKQQWKDDLALIQNQLEAEVNRTSHIDIPALQNQLKQNGVPNGVWDEHLTLANNIRELVAKIDVLKATSEGLTKQQEEETILQQEKTELSTTTHDELVRRIQNEISQLRQQVNQSMSSSPTFKAAKVEQEQLLKTKEDLQKQIEETKRRIEQLHSYDIHPAEEADTMEDSIQNVDEELLSTQIELQRAEERCQHLQVVANESPALLHEIEAKEADIQRLEFESRELMIKGKAARQQYESTISDILMKIETNNSKAKKLDSESAVLQDDAKKQLTNANTKHNNEVSEAQQLLAAAKQQYEREVNAMQLNEQTVDKYYGEKLQQPFQPCSEDKELEQRLSSIDNAILQVQNDLVELDQRDLTVREKFERNESTMLSQRDVLLQNITIWTSQGSQELVHKAQDDLSKLQETIESLQHSMDTFSSHARVTRDKHHQREQVLMTQRDELVEAVAEVNKQNLAILIETSTLTSQHSEFSSDVDVESAISQNISHRRLSALSPLGPAAPAWLHPVTVTRQSLNEMWGLVCVWLV